MSRNRCLSLQILFFFRMFDCFFSCAGDIIFIPILNRNISSTIFLIGIKWAWHKNYQRVLKIRNQRKTSNKKNWAIKNTAKSIEVMKNFFFKNLQKFDRCCSRWKKYRQMKLCLLKSTNLLDWIWKQSKCH